MNVGYPLYHVLNQWKDIKRIEKRMFEYHHTVRTAKPLLRFSSCEGFNQVLLVLGEYFHIKSDRLGFCFLHVLKCNPWKGRMVGNQLVKQNSQSVKINGLVIWLPQCELRWNVL